VHDARVVVLAVPYFAVDAAAAAGAWAHKVVVDVTNFYEPRDGADLRPGPGGASAEVQRKLAGALVVKASNNPPAHAPRTGSPGMSGSRSRLGRA
jgi:predicted dinucleotide-binding enzyme